MRKVSGSVRQQSECIESAILSIGPVEAQVVWLEPSDGLTSRNFEYADLLKSYKVGSRVGAVIEKDGSPLIYMADIPQESPEIGKKLAQLLGNRGETAVLLDLHRAPGKQTISARAWPCKLDAHTPVQLNLDNPVDARSILGDLQEGLWGSNKDIYQEQRLRDLLVDSVEKVSSEFLRATESNRHVRESGQEVLALVGRALFTRFLIDRGILSKKTAPTLWRSIGVDGELAFSSAETAASTCLWLDQTFNGEFMPLPAKSGYQKYFEILLKRSPESLTPLSWILGRTDAGGQLPLWEKLDFSHIPAGILSEVYEDYAHRKAPRTAKKTSVHFTPRHIARTMVRQALAGLPPETVAEAKILDPAVGAAVFLSLAFRELARHRAISDGGVWPDSKKLREILYFQLRGMDINSDALNLAALTLYLTAIELDANPVPPEKLKFDHQLIGSVLHDVRQLDLQDPNAAKLGSLRKKSVVGVGIFDVVLGNPPWTSLGLGDDSEGGEANEERAASDALVHEVESIATACIESRGVTVSDRYAHPDKVPDLAFLWKATQWAKPGGIISLLVHQRLLIKQSTQWKIARQALFSSIEIDGILNAGEFANHDQLIWPGIESPFCIIFARNNAPPKNHRTLLLTLAVEPTLLRRRQIRIDPSATMSITLDDFDEYPGGMVVRTKGCELDRALLQRWTARVALEGNLVDIQNHRRLPLTTIGSCIDQITKKTPKRGFKTGLKNTKLPDWYDDLHPNAKELPGKAKERIAGEISVSEIHLNFTRRPVRSSPTLEWYTPPLLLIRQAAGKLGDLERIVLITPSDDQAPVLYPFAFLGAPLINKSAELLYAKYIAVWINSSVFSYYQTLTSTQLSFGIKTLLNDEILGTPTLDPKLAIKANLTNKKEIEHLFAQLARPKDSSQSEIDEWVFNILGMDEKERQLVEDTLSVAYPIGTPRQSGKTWVSVAQIECYLTELRSELAYAKDTVNVQSLELIPINDSLRGWRFVTWQLTSQTAINCLDAELEKIDEDSLLHLVRSKYPEGEVWARSASGQFVFGQLALNRLWLPSRACLVAQVMVAWADQVIE